MDLEYEEALARVLAEVPPAAAERVPLSEAQERVVSEDVLSPLDLPPFDNSSMDGYAVRAEDVAGARAESAVRLRVAGRVEAGEAFAGEMPAGSCVRVFTGSPMPRGADAVLMQEDARTEVDRSKRSEQRVGETSGLERSAAAGSAEQEIFVLERVEPGENVRRCGEDVRRGARLAEAGERLGIGDLCLLAGTGVQSVSVGRRPEVGLVATGSELREPGQELAPGQIYESNRLGLAALCRRAGGVPRSFPLVRDELAATRGALAQALEECDIVVSSGGASVGDMDFIKPAFEQAGGRVDFWRVAIRPGRPVVFGRREKKLFFGLPGNPVSALVTFLLLVRPAVLRWQGARDVSLPSQPGVLAAPLVNRGGRRHFLRVRIDGGGLVHPAGMQASHALRSLAASNGLVDVGPGQSVAAGATVGALRWD